MFYKIRQEKNVINNTTFNFLFSKKFIFLFITFLSGVLSNFFELENRDIDIEILLVFFEYKNVHQFHYFISLLIIFL